MDDKELIDMVARLWVDYGGDAEGMAYCWQDIRNRIMEIEEEKDNEPHINEDGREER